MSLRAFFTSINGLHERQDRELEATLKRSPLIGSFQRIKRDAEGQGGEALVVDRTRESIIYLVAGPLDSVDRLTHRLWDEKYVRRHTYFARRIREEAREWGSTSANVTLVRNAASTDLLTAVRDGGKRTGIVIDGHGCTSWVNMTDENGKRVTNKILKEVVGPEKIRILVKATCRESDMEDTQELLRQGNEVQFGESIAQKTLLPPFFGEIGPPWEK
ncbi:hypothetical protein JXD20_04145 [Candidatus Peregrinibacteria bacterium]|nr:hypothetical protein [Candidatus Peregrinibacteria bacterium]